MKTVLALTVKREGFTKLHVWFVTSLGESGRNSDTDQRRTLNFSRGSFLPHIILDWPIAENQLGKLLQLRNP